jgi:hypothetical protein
MCQKYRDNVLAPRIVSHFDNHALADRPMFMDDNARPHRARIVQHFSQQGAVLNFSANKVPYMLYRVHVWQHRRPRHCLNSPLLWKMLHNSGSMWPSVVVHEHWPVSQRMIVRTWRRVHWSDESRLLLRPPDSRARVWHQRNTSFQDNHIMGTTAFGGGGVTVWGCLLFPQDSSS